MLTRKQRDLLLFIDAKLRSEGISPSFEEMKIALGLKSKSGIHRLINALVERGFIKRLANRARALEVVRLAEEVSPQRGSPAPAYVQEVMATYEANTAAAHQTAQILPLSTRRGASPAQAAQGPLARTALNMVELPLHGRIAAGLPIEALEHADTLVAVPTTLVGKGEHYALEIEGDSMVDAGILTGDIVVIRKTDAAKDGEIVVALVDDNEATLKRIEYRDHKVHLLPANKMHHPQSYQAPRVRVQGKLVGLLRRYD
jgi:repressor LexA